MLQVENKAKLSIKKLILSISQLNHFYYLLSTKI